MSQVTEEFLEHHGIKGMKWGLRHDPKRSSARAAKKLAKKDAKWEKHAGSVDTWVKAHNMAAALANNGDIDRINNKPQYKGQNFTKDSPLRRQYYNEHEQAFNKRMQAAYTELTGTNPSGTKRIKINPDGSAQFVEVKHADGDPGIKIIFDDRGYIVDFKLVPNEMKQSQDAVVGDFLEHHGVKGQKWGIRNAKKRIFKDTSRTTFKKPPAHLSDQELSRRIQRMQMEQRYNEMNRTKTQQGSRFAGDILKRAGTQAAVTMLAGAAIFAGKKAVEYFIKRKTGQQLKLF